MNNDDLVIFAGRSHPEFAKEVANRLYLEVGKAEITQFSNNNIWVQLKENVREKDVFIIQTASPKRLHDHWQELLIFIHAAKHASASRVTAVIPYFYYARSDKKDKPRISITAQLNADLLQTAGADRVITMDLHSHQVQGFFRFPADQLRSVNTLCKRLREMNLNSKKAVLIAADAGEAKHIGSFANRLGLPFAIIDKRRYDNSEKPEAVGIVGEVEGKMAIIIDDEIASGGTLIESAKFLKQRGADLVVAAVTHGVFSGKALDKIRDSEIGMVIVTDTMPCPQNKIPDKVAYVTVTDLFAEAIRCVHTGASISHIFERDWDKK